MSGTYTLTVTKGGCTSDPATTDVTVTGPCIYKLYLPLVAKCYWVQVIIASNNGPVCEGETIELYGPDGMVSYRWVGPDGWTSSLQNPTRPNATTDMAGIYTLTVTTSGCSRSDTTFVTVNPKPTANAGADQTKYKADGKTTFRLSGSASGGTSPYSYKWSSSDSGVDIKSPNSKDTDVDITGTGSKTITLEVTDAKGCKDTDDVVLTVNIPPPPCEEKICNGGFETTGCWSINYGPPRPPAYSAVVVHSGSWAMRLGITSESDAQSYSSVYQMVTIPGNAASATLSFWYYPICQDAYPYDWQDVILYTQSWGFITRVMPQMCSNSRTWTYHTFDLTPYKGQTIILYFNVYNDGAGNLKTAMYLDDASVWVCY
jgi:hypothetical protein